MNSHSKISFIILIFKLYYELIGHEELPLFWILIAQPFRFAKDV